MVKSKSNFQTRSRARFCAVQALYQWQITAQSLSDISTQFSDTLEMRKADDGFFRELLIQVPEKLERIDAELSKYLDRSIHEVDPVERVILRIGGYELIYRQDIPYKVVINEAVNLTKIFGGEQGHRYVNSVLDKLAKQAGKDCKESVGVNRA